ncbi:MAG: nucleotidyltransferase domain-containing protein [Saprospirales bacterium]|nr:nucleotidyltransferase domain-containing protein [Saprospirales bacterium]
MSAVSAPPQLCPTKHALLCALWYFEIFQHPLTLEELRRYSNCAGVSQEILGDKLGELVAEGAAFQFEHFFQTRDEPGWVARRRAYNQRADEFLPIARRMARFIGAFPFIRGVFVSGSLSKHCMAPDGDIDFFIITAPGRLWLARTLLVVFKKLFLFDSHKYFCINYFVDTEHLEIEEKNLFTATETATLLPLYGREWYERFVGANAWAWAHFPNLPPRPTGQTPPHRRAGFKLLWERVLYTYPGQWLDIWAMRATVWYWRRKFRKFDDRTFDSALRSRRYMSKHHPLYFQKKVMEAFAKRAGQYHTPSAGGA